MDRAWRAARPSLVAALACAVPGFAFNSSRLNPIGQLLCRRTLASQGRSSATPFDIEG